MQPVSLRTFIVPKEFPKYLGGLSIHLIFERVIFEIAAANSYAISNSPSLELV